MFKWKYISVYVDINEQLSKKKKVKPMKIICQTEEEERKREREQYECLKMLKG